MGLHEGAALHRSVEAVRLGKLTGARRTVAASLAAVAFALCVGACGGGAERGKQGGANNAANARANSAGTEGARGAALDAEIERLERHAERSPSDDDVRASLAAAYVKRGDARRAANDITGAFNDYQSAIRNDSDNEAALRGVTELKPQVEGEREGEYGEPEPLPITPGVTSGAAPASPTPTPATASTPDKRRP
jgi:tetratricopeptide (TPR) repeat protein